MLLLNIHYKILKYADHGLASKVFYPHWLASVSHNYGQAWVLTAAGRSVNHDEPLICPTLHHKITRSCHAASTMPHYSCIHASNFPASPARHVSIRLSVLRAHGIYSLEDL